MQLDPGNANSAYELGEMRRKARQFDDAQRYFEQALQHYPDFPEARLGLAAVLLEKKLPDQALAHAQRAVALDPENEVAWYRLAKIQKTLGNAGEQQKALTEYRRLHDRASQQKGLEPVFSPREVTEDRKSIPTPRSEHGQIRGALIKRRPQRLKPLLWRGLTARLKPCPTQNHPETQLIGDSLGKRDRCYGESSQLYTVGGQFLDGRRLKSGLLIDVFQLAPARASDRNSNVRSRLLTNKMRFLASWVTNAIA